MSYRIVGVGEVLWDLLPDGPRLGGAPANVACHAHALGANASVITRVGQDMLGHEVKTCFKEMGLALAGIQEDRTAPTGTVSVSLTSEGIPAYRIHEHAAWDFIDAGRDALKCVRLAHAVCFGTLAQRHAVSRRAIQRLLAGTRAAAWRVLDVNLRQQFYDRDVLAHSLTLANLLKLNDQELPVLAEMFSLKGDVQQQIESLAKKFQLQVVALTCGAAGSLLYRDGRWARGAAAPVKVKDTIGAGDAFTAALCLGLLRNLDLDDINFAANQTAAHVCASAGAVPELPAELRRLLNPEGRRMGNGGE